ncbi:MAG: monovalent cation/H+ antiporter subunit A [Burkholderiales bacterium]|nr:monovalent cation/H+ antiporter subunit A [Burkholderiales bacterium]
MSTSSMLFWLAALPFAGAALPVLSRTRGRTAIAWSAAIVPIAGLVVLWVLASQVFDGGAWRASVPWMEGIGLNFSLRLDGLALLFCGLIFVIGLLVILYARYYLAADDPLGRLLALLLAFMGAMIGIALSDNLLLTLVFWELTSLTSFLLIGYWSHRPDARQGARMALAVTGMGGLALLGGVLLLGDMAGTYEISELARQGDAIRAHPHYAAALVLILVGAFTKSAQFPFQFWLPNAMAAPTPVSAYLHSATMVKAGIFLLARLWPALSGTELWFYLVAGTGLVTLVFGAYTALFRHDLKGLLAYSTISHLGLIVLLLGMNSKLAAVAAVFHIINHATFKASLFMAAGIIDHETGTRDMRKLAGLWRYLPYTAVLATVAAAAMAGVPLLNGFLSKEMFFAETLTLRDVGALSWIVPAVSTFAGVFSVAYSTRFIHDVFFNGEWDATARMPHEPPRWMRIPVEVLVALCLLVGMAPNLTVGPTLAVAAASVVGGTLPEYSLAIWHGFNLPLAMSLIATLLGLVLYFGAQRIYNLHAFEGRSPWTGARLYQVVIVSLAKFARRFTHFTANGSLQRQVIVLVAVTLAVGWWPFAGGIPERVLDRYTPIDAIAVIGWLVLVIALGATVTLHRQRLTALILVGAVGLMVAAAFARFSAPDLALTQLTVEVATILLMLLALPLLPATTPIESSQLRRARDGIIAAACGLGLGGTAWWMMTTAGSSVSSEHVARSVPGGGGTNVVNVILVDFRGFDTYGEITVLAVAALGIVALLGGASSERESDEAPSFRPAMLALLARALLPLSLLLSAYLLLRGHNLPGGGFVAGLITGAILAVLYVGNGAAWSRRQLPLDFPGLLVAGLAMATATGLGAWLFGRPFLTSAHGHVHPPIIGDLHLATAALFDLGVYLVVVGATMLILERLGRLMPERGVGS